MALTVHGPPHSTNVGRALIVLYEKSVEDFAIVPVSLFAGEHKGPEFLKLNPFGQVPAITSGELTLFESRAIARVLAHKYEGQGTPLYGSSPKDKALVEQWIEVEAQTFNKPLRTVVYQAVVAPMFGRATDEKAVAEDLAKVGTILDVYEKHLSKSKYLAGDFYSLADLTHIPGLYYVIVKAKKVELLESRPAVKAWWEDIFSRPATQKWVQLASAAFASKE